MQRFEAIQVRQWRGVNEDENPNVPERGEFITSQNLALLGDLIGTRPGIELEATDDDYEAAIAPTGTTDASITMLYEFNQGVDFKQTRGTDTYLLAMAEGNTNGEAHLYTDDSTTVTQHANWTGDANQDYVYVAATHQRSVWIAGGDPTGGTTSNDNSFGYWEPSGTNTLTPVDIPNLSGTPTSGFPKFVFQKWGYIFVNGIRPTTGTDEDQSYNPMITRYHTLGTDPQTASNWATGNSIGAGVQVGDLGGLSDYGDEFTTGLAEYDDGSGSWLLILTNRKIASIARDPRTGDFVHDDDIPNGCVHQRAFVSLGEDAGDAVYMSEKGIHSIRQSQQFGEKADTFLSWKIRRTFEKLNPSRLHLACGAYDDVEGWVLFAVSTGSSTAHDLILCLDVKNSRDLTSDNAIWHFWRINSGFRINCMTSARDSNGKRRIYVGTVADGDNEARVGRFTRDVYTDFGGGYAISGRTAYDNAGTPHIEKQLGDMWIDAGPQGNYMPSVKTYFDYGQRSAPARNFSLPTASGVVWDNTSFNETGAGEWDNFTWADNNFTIRQTKLYQLGRFFSVSHEFAHSGAGEPVFLAGFTQEYAEVGKSRAA